MRTIMQLHLLTMPMAARRKRRSRRTCTKPTDMMRTTISPSKTDRKGQTIQYVYDALNRLTQKNYPDSTSAEYTYDLVGKILSVNDPTGSYGFAYDNMGRLSRDHDAVFVLSQASIHKRVRLRRQFESGR